MSSSEFSSFIHRFEVLYSDTDEKPDGTLNELNGHSADINKGCGGDYVWLRPHKAEYPGQMITTIRVDVRSEHIDGLFDLARGAGGDYRYLSCFCHIDPESFITDAMLWRPDEGQEHPPPGWHGMTGDINRGRGSDYLYLIWKTKKYTGPDPF